MQIVIDISEDAYKRHKKRVNMDMCTELDIVVAKGTPLPKGHGRLIDADNLPLNAIDDANYGSNYIKIAPTIIEADTTGSEEV